MGIKRSDQHSQGGKPQMGYRGGMVPPPRAGTSGGPPHLPLPPPPPPPKQHQIPQHYNRLMPAQHFRLVQQPRSDGGYIHSGGEAPPGIRQAPLTPPQQDKSHSLVKIASHTFALPPNQVRPPPPYAYRGPPPPPAMQPRPPGHHSRPPAMYPGAPGGGQMVYNMAPTLIYATPMSLPPPQYQQPPPRQQFYPATPPAMPPMVPPHHPYFGSFPNRQTQPSFYMPTGGGPGAGVGGGGGGPPTGPPNSIPPIPHQPHQPIIHVGRFHVPTQQPVSIAADKRKRRRHAIAIVDPRSGKDVTEEILDEDSISGESSERQTPQPVNHYYLQ